LRREEEWLKKLKKKAENLATIGIGASLMVWGTAMVQAGAAGSAVLIADDALIIGFADDPLLVVTGGVAVTGGGIIMVGGLIDWIGL
jgi:hypothetical protein